MEYTLRVDGFRDAIDFDASEIGNVHRPILSQLSALWTEKKRRIICLYAGPPGTGKTSRTVLWEILSREDENLADVQALPVDGFHYTNRYLASRTVVADGRKVSLKAIKGAPETYDVGALADCIRRLAAGESVRWPFYDRNIHDPLPEAIEVSAPILVVEGNWVLYTDGPWAALKSWADFTVYQDAEELMLKRRLIDRKIRGGASPREAEDHYRRTDSRNIQRVKGHRARADAEIVWNGGMVRWRLDWQQNSAKEEGSGF